MAVAEIEVKVKFPKDVYLSLQSLKMNREKMGKKIRQSFAVQLYRDGTLSIGKSAELAGVCIAEFMDNLVNNDVPVTDYSETDYEIDKVALKQISKK